MKIGKLGSGTIMESSGQTQVAAWAATAVRRISFGADALRGMTRIGVPPCLPRTCNDQAADAAVHAELVVDS